jgi:hypothetical protein
VSVPHGTQVQVVRAGDPAYDQLIGQLRTPDLAAQMWADAEHRLEEQPGKTWVFVTVNGEVAAWTSAWPDDGVVRCGDNYERRGPGREWHLWALAYRHRDRLFDRITVPLLTYVFEQPLRRHEADGWARTGVEGPGELAGHWWYELRRGTSVSS